MILSRIDYLIPHYIRDPGRPRAFDFDEFGPFRMQRGMLGGIEPQGLIIMFIGRDRAKVGTIHSHLMLVAFDHRAEITRMHGSGRRAGRFESPAAIHRRFKQL